jgi:hypothetical protein
VPGGVRRMWLQKARADARVLQMGQVSAWAESCPARTARTRSVQRRSESVSEQVGQMDVISTVPSRSLCPNSGEACSWHAQPGALAPSSVVVMCSRAEAGLGSVSPVRCRGPGSSGVDLSGSSVTARVTGAVMRRRGRSPDGG